MTLNRDPVDILARLAPPAPDPARLAAIAVRTAALRSAPARRRRSLRGSAVVVAAVALSAGGVGLAMAGDPALVPTPVGTLTSLWGDDGPWPGHAVDPADAVRVGSTPFADGQVFSVWSARSADGEECFATLVEPALPAPDPATSPDESATPASAGCEPDLEAGGELGLLATTTIGDRETFFMVAQGGTARATLTLPDGSVQELLAAAGSYHGWLPASITSGIVTGYDADGTASESLTVRS